MIHHGELWLINRLVYTWPIIASTSHFVLDQSTDLFTWNYQPIICLHFALVSSRRHLKTELLWKKSQLTPVIAQNNTWCDSTSTKYPCAVIASTVICNYFISFSSFLNNLFCLTLNFIPCTSIHKSSSLFPSPSPYLSPSAFFDISRAIISQVAIPFIFSTITSVLLAPICLSICLSVCLSIYWSIYLRPLLSVSSISACASSQCALLLSWTLHYFK